MLDQIPGHFVSNLNHCTEFVDAKALSTGGDPLLPIEDGAWAVQFYQAYEKYSIV